jgi:hypothetical protein
MRSFVVAASLAALLSVPAAAEPEFSPDRVKATVAFLADDLLEGRETGSRGHEIAARYVASRFAGFGLVPAGKDGGWLQPVSLSETRDGGTPGKVTITGKAGAQSWLNATDAIVGLSQTDKTTDVSGDLVFAGFGIDAPKQGFNDYNGLDVRGKIVVVLSGIPKGPPSEVLAHLGTRKGAMAAARGAIGIVTIATLDSAKRRPWARLQEYATQPRMTWVGTDGVPHVDAPAIKAAAVLNGPAAEIAFAGAKLPLAKILADADRMGGKPKGFALKTRIRIESSAQQRTLQSPEVVGLLPGSDPVLKNEYVVLMAHLDHLGMRAGKPGDNIYNGALDNAAGVAVMLEVARAFTSESTRPKRSILFVANTAEEKGLLGAEAFANNPPVPIDQITSVVDLDQPLLLYDFTDVVAFGGDHSTMGPAISRALDGTGIALAPDPMPAETIFVRSDHYTFVKRGVPALLLATGFANGGKDAWEHFLSTDYHQPSDDMKLPINWAAGARYARVNYRIARELADDATRPRWYAGDFFGDTFAANSPKVPRP